MAEKEKAVRFSIRGTLRIADGYDVERAMSDLREATKGLRQVSQVTEDGSLDPSIPENDVVCDYSIPRLSKLSI